MLRRTCSQKLWRAALRAAWCGVLLCATNMMFVAARPQKQTVSPTDVVRQFYRGLHEKRFREAFALSIYKPAVEPLNESEMAELRPDFEKIAAAIPPDFQVSGEQISGETATVFVRIGQTAESILEPVSLLRTSEGWIIGDKENQTVVKKSGKEFFFKARIETHHAEVDDMMLRLYSVQNVYQLQHQGEYADLPKLIELGYIPKDIAGVETTGYRFQIALGKDKKTYVVTAEPASYNRSGKLSYFMNQTGAVKSKDVKGKPYTP